MQTTLRELYARQGRRGRPRSSGKDRALPTDATLARSLPGCRGFQPDQSELEISGIAQAVHHLHELAKAERLVRADENRFVFVIVGGGIKRGRKLRARHQALTDRNRLVRLD